MLENFAEKIEAQKNSLECDGTFGGSFLKLTGIMHWFITCRAIKGRFPD